jgi:hypothetical protein
MASSHSSSSAPPARRRVVTPQISGRNRRGKLEAATARAAVIDGGYSGTQTASHYVPVAAGSRTVYEETKVEIPAPTLPVPSVSLPPVPGLINLSNEDYARPAENHGGVPFIIREPVDDDEDDGDDDDDEPCPSGKVNRSSLTCTTLMLTCSSAFPPS